MNIIIYNILTNSLIQTLCNICIQLFQTQQKDAKKIATAFLHNIS